MPTISEGIFRPSVPDLFALRQRLQGDFNPDGSQRLYLQWKHEESWGGSATGTSTTTSTSAIYFYYLGF